jgi:hypothetical protein
MHDTEYLTQNVWGWIMYPGQLSQSLALGSSESMGDLSSHLKDRLDLGRNRNRRLISTCMEVALSDGFATGNKALHNHPDVLVRNETNAFLDALSLGS